MAVTSARAARLTQSDAIHAICTRSHQQGHKHSADGDGGGEEKDKRDDKNKRWRILPVTPAEEAAQVAQLLKFIMMLLKFHLHNVETWNLAAIPSHPQGSNGNTELVDETFKDACKVGAPRGGCVPFAFACGGRLETDALVSRLPVLRAPPRFIPPYTHRPSVRPYCPSAARPRNHPYVHLSIRWFVRPRCSWIR